MVNAEVVQAAGDNHNQIREVVFGVSENIFHDAGTLDA